MSVAQTLAIARGSTRPTRGKRTSKFVLRYEVAMPRISARTLRQRNRVKIGHAGHVLSFGATAEAYRPVAISFHGFH